MCAPPAPLTSRPPRSAGARVSPPLALNCCSCRCRLPSLLLPQRLRCCSGRASGFALPCACVAMRAPATSCPPPPRPWRSRRACALLPPAAASRPPASLLFSALPRSCSGTRTCRCRGRCCRRQPLMTSAVRVASPLVAAALARARAAATVGAAAASQAAVVAAVPCRAVAWPPLSREPPLSARPSPAAAAASLQPAAAATLLVLLPPPPA